MHDDILRRIKNMGPVVDSNEAMRCEYISTILHTAVSILGNLVITPQANIIGEKNTGRVDYATKKLSARCWRNNLHNRRQTKSGDYGYLPKLTTMSKCL